MKIIKKYRKILKERILWRNKPLTWWYNKESNTKEGEGDKKEVNKDENKEGKKEEGTKDEDKKSEVILLIDFGPIVNKKNLKWKN